MAIIAFITRFTGISGNNCAAYAACRALFGSGGGVGRNTAGIGIGTGFGAYATVAALIITAVAGKSDNNFRSFAASGTKFGQRFGIGRNASGVGVFTNFGANTGVSLFVITAVTSKSGGDCCGFSAGRALFGSSGSVFGNSAGIRVFTNSRAYACPVFIAVPVIAGIAGFNGGANSASRTGFGFKGGIFRNRTGKGIRANFFAHTNTGLLFIAAVTIIKAV